MSRCSLPVVTAATWLLGGAALAAASTTGASSAAAAPYGRVTGEAKYVGPPSVREKFLQDGYATLDDVLLEDEVKEIEACYERFMLPPGHPDRIEVPSKDFCDMSKPFDTPFEEYSIINCMVRLCLIENL